jgi:hypothetical protein
MHLVGEEGNYQNYTSLYCSNALALVLLPYTKAKKRTLKKGCGPLLLNLVPKSAAKRAPTIHWMDGCPVLFLLSCG